MDWVGALAFPLLIFAGLAGLALVIAACGYADGQRNRADIDNEQ